MQPTAVPGNIMGPIRVNTSLFRRRLSSDPSRTLLVQASQVKCNDNLHSINDKFTHTIVSIEQQSISHPLSYPDIQCDTKYTKLFRHKLNANKFVQTLKRKINVTQ